MAELLRKENKLSKLDKDYQNTDYNNKILSEKERKHKTKTNKIQSIN